MQMVQKSMEEKGKKKLKKERKNTFFSSYRKKTKYLDKEKTCHF